MPGNELLSIINQVRENKGQLPVGELPSNSRLREDIGFKSLDLAEFTVRIEEKFGVDVADYDVGEIGGRVGCCHDSVYRVARDGGPDGGGRSLLGGGVSRRCA